MKRTSSRSMARRIAWLVALGCTVHGAVAAAAPQYNRDIRPILAENCFACHGPDSAARKADLRLDQREAAIEMGAILPGKPDDSEMLRRILSSDPDEVMPPPETKKNITAAQKKLLADWIKNGAEYQLHWSFIPPQRTPLPHVKNEAAVRNPIDRFILARLEAAGLSLAPEADKRTLARRVSLDLVGLPPPPEMVEAFVQDTSPSAYEKLVDKLLASERWGEHRGRYWLDYARYADTHGIHFDNFREMWTYRDWVIGAFNRNLPYDEFTIESLAGDLLPDRTTEQLIGSGFNRCNITTNEGGIIDEEYLVLYDRDRTETTAQVWMGLTAGCAVCHSHKFDPLSQQEFYELAAFFNNTTQAAKDGNIKDTPPILVVPQPEDQSQWNELEGRAAAAKEKVESRRQASRPEFDTWLAGAAADDVAKSLPQDALHLWVPLAEEEAAATKAELDGKPRELSLAETALREKGHLSPAAVQITKGAIAEVPQAGDFSADESFSVSAWIKLPANDSSGAIVARMDDRDNYRGWDFWVEGRRVGMHLVHHWNDDAIKVVTRPQVAGNQWTHVAVTYDGSKRAAGVKIYVNGQSQNVNVQADTLKNDIRTEVPLKIGQRHTSSPVSGVALEDLRIYRRTLAPQDVDALAKIERYKTIVAKAADKRSAAEKNDLFGFWLASVDADYKQASVALAGLERQQEDIKARGTVAYVMNEKNAEAMAFVLYRGEYDQRRDKVLPGTPAVLPPWPEEFPKNRLGLAKWLLLPEQPLTARVTVNRFWQEVFGTGLVKTAGDFGVMGELPSHPELLDWLAVDFRESGWDVKRLFKLLVISAAYRQSAAVTPLKLEKDPENRLLSRGPRFRMDAEMVRDYALAASGLLVPKLGGPSVKPYQPSGIWEAIAMNVSNTRSYQRGTGDDLYRRSLYTFWKRQAPPASMDLFNAPNREYCVVRRERTNTPLQALVTLNDEQFIEAARHLAQRALRDGGKDAPARLRWIGLRLLAREFRPEEVKIVEGSLAELLAFYEAHPDEAKQLLAVGEDPLDAELQPVALAAWTMLVNELMNLDEVLNK